MFYSVREKREAEIRKELREMAQDPEIQKEQLTQSRERSDYTNAKKAEQERQEREVLHERRVQEAKMMKDQRLMQQNG